VTELAETVVHDRLEECLLGGEVAVEGASQRRYDAAHDVVIHETTDPDVVIVEYGLRGTLEPTGEAFDQPFSLVVTVRDSHIVHSRDYSDPIVGAEVLGIVPQLVEALTAAGD